MRMVATEAYVGGSSDQAELSPQEHESWRIALYYYYIDIDDISHHIAFHKELCDSAGFQGRLRISAEGINGVLSGLYSSLQNYEASLIKELARISIKACDDLDMKYCLLRTDLPVEVQLFDSLSVKETGQVVSLFEMDYSPSSQTNTSGRRSKQSNRRRRRKEQRKQEHEENPNHPQLPLELQQQIMKQDPAPHLKPDEWNAKLQEHVSSQSNDALLLDLRNVYESRVGHFAVPHVPTMLTNTRKYSDLPYMLASNKGLEEKQEIFMYCTGGVRCERVSMFLQSIYPGKSFYQLEGGIQNYLKDSQIPEFYKGKNFVFDPRRTDPVHFGSTVGKCIVCDVLHDDYDNGHAPSENKEARCNTCRMLILVCNSCRVNYKCWGEKENADNTSLLYCGNDRCVHEGVAPEPEIIRPWESDVVDVTTTTD